MPVIKFEANNNYLHINLIDRAYRESNFKWDRDSIKGTVSVRAGVFNGEFETTIWSHELSLLLQLLYSLEEKVGTEDTTDFEFRDGTINIGFRLYRTGVIELECEVCENPGDNTRLQFVISVDQSYLTLWIDQINKILDVYPQVL